MEKIYVMVDKNVNDFITLLYKYSKLINTKYFIYLLSLLLSKKKKNNTFTLITVKMQNILNSKNN